MAGYVRDHDHGEVANLGVVSMRVIVSKAETNGSFALTEFRGAAGRWTIPHIHRDLIESFYVLEGTFTFNCDGQEIQAAQGAFVMIPKSTPHFMTAGPRGGALLTLFAPGGLEEMFLELGRLPAESITDPKIRAEISKRHDSVPV